MLNKSFQRFANLILIWSIIYFFVLLVLEDLKKSVVTSHFAAHWILLIIILLAIWQLWQSEEWNPVVPKIKKIWLLFYISLLGSGIVFIWVSSSKLIGLILAIFYIIIFYLLGKKIIRELLN